MKNKVSEGSWVLPNTVYIPTASSHQVWPVPICTEPRNPGLARYRCSGSEDLERFVLPEHILWKTVVLVDNHPCCFMPHFSWLQLPAMSLCSDLPCQTEERQDFLPMEMIIRCNQTISRSSFWHEKQIEVVWSHKIINCLFPVLNHFSASFLNHLQLFSSPFRSEGAQSICMRWAWLHHSFIWGENYLLVWPQVHVAKDWVSPLGQSVALCAAA